MRLDIGCASDVGIHVALSYNTETLTPQYLVSNKLVQRSLDDKQIIQILRSLRRRVRLLFTVVGNGYLVHTVFKL